MLFTLFWIFSPYWLLKNSREKEALAAWNFYNPTATMTPEELKMSNEEFEKLTQSAKEHIREKEIKLKRWVNFTLFYYVKSWF